MFNGIVEICHKLENFDPDNIYNMDKTGFFYKVLPNRGYLPKRERKTARGTKLMKDKDRVTLFVCTNASGTDKVPLSKFIHFYLLTFLGCW